MRCTLENTAPAGLHSPCSKHLVRRGHTKRSSRCTPKRPPLQRKTRHCSCMESAVTHCLRKNVRQCTQCNSEPCRNNSRVSLQASSTQTRKCIASAVPDRQHTNFPPHMANTWTNLPCSCSMSVIRTPTQGCKSTQPLGRRFPRSCGPHHKRCRCSCYLRTRLLSST